MSDFVATKKQRQPSKPSGRPFGVTLLAIFYVIAAVIFIVIAVLSGFAARGAILRTVGLGSGALGLISVVLVILAVVSLLVAYGLWEGKKWGWLLALIIAVIHIIFNLLRLFHAILVPVISIIISVIVIWYLTRKRVKDYFDVNM